MSMINVSLVGNLTRAPEQICFASGRVKTVLVIAVNSQSQKNIQKKTEHTADFYRVETWGKLAELAQKYLNKGNQVGVSGKLVMEPWTDREGNKRLTPVVSATQISFPPRLKVTDDTEPSSSYETDDDLFAGARAVTVAEPPSHYYASVATSISALASSQAAVNYC